MLKRTFIAFLMVVSVSVAASAQLEWDKRRPLKPVPNPSPVGAARVDIISETKALLERNQIPVKSESAEDESGRYVIVTEPVVFARGIVAKTQLGHFAEIGAARVQDISRARVQLRIEISPSNPTTSMVGIAATFEGLRQGAGQEWIGTPSLGLLEDKMLKVLITNLTGRTFEDVKPDEGILEVN